MKLLAFAGIVLSSLIAMATPRVGDQVSYNVVVTTNQGTANGTLTFMLTAYDLATDSWTKQTQVNIGNNANQSSEQVSSKSLLSDEMIQNILMNCAQSNGRNEALQTPAGAINTCALDYEQNGSNTTIWIGPVPMGIVQFQSKNAESSTMGTLSSFVNGN